VATAEQLRVIEDYVKEVESKIQEYKIDSASFRKSKLILKHKEYRTCCLRFEQRLKSICEMLHLSADMLNKRSVLEPAKREFSQLEEGLEAYMAKSTTTREERKVAFKALTTLRLQGEDVLNYKEIDIYHLEIDHFATLGSGAFATVFPGKYNGEDVAVKKINLTGGAERLRLVRKMAQREVERMNQLKHDNILTIIGGCTILPDKFYIITELAQCSLRELLDDKRALTPVEMVKLLLDAAKAIGFLHNTHKMLHCDIKPANMLIFEGNTLKVADFGLTKMRDETTTSTALGIGTVQYMAPEIFEKNPKYTTASDVYSYAVLINEVCSREAPWDNNIVYIQTQVTAGQRPSIKLTAEIEPLRTVITEGWAHDASHRPNITTIYQALQRLSEGLLTDHIPIPATTNHIPARITSSIVNPSLRVRS
jgi:tRNA A-37 threonylcarbamoyl transferase component Bud32